MQSKSEIDGSRNMSQKSHEATYLRRQYLREYQRMHHVKQHYHQNIQQARQMYEGKYCKIQNSLLNESSENQYRIPQGSQKIYLFQLLPNKIQHTFTQVKASIQLVWDQCSEIKEKINEIFYSALEHINIHQQKMHQVKKQSQEESIWSVGIIFGVNQDKIQPARVAIIDHYDQVQQLYAQVCQENMDKEKEKYSQYKNRAVLLNENNQYTISSNCQALDLVLLKKDANIQLYLIQIAVQKTNLKQANKYLQIYGQFLQGYSLTTKKSKRREDILLIILQGITNMSCEMHSKNKLKIWKINSKCKQFLSNFFRYLINQPKKQIITHFIQKVH